MKQLTCEICGSTDLIKDNGVFVCQACGCKYSIEEARKMMVEGVVEVKGTVKQDRSDELVRLLELARGGIDSSNFKDAESYAMRALEIDLNNGKAWAIKAEAIDWQMTLTDEREAETAQARLEMYKLLRETSEDPSDILDATEVISKHMQHVKLIVKAEANLFTGPLETDPGAKAEGYVHTLAKHVEFRNTELESMGTLAKLWKGRAEEVLGKNGSSEPAQIEALTRAVDTLTAIQSSIPQTIADMHWNAATKLAIAGVHGSTAADCRWWEAYPNLNNYGSSNAKKMAFDQYRKACDACIAAHEAAIVLLRHQSVTEHMGKKDVDDLLLLYYESLGKIEAACIDRGFTNSWQLADTAKEIRRKHIREWNAEAEKIKYERSHTPEIMELRKKMDEATQTPEFRQYVIDRTMFYKLRREWEDEKGRIFNTKRTKAAEEKKNEAGQKMEAYQESEAWSKMDAWDSEAEALGIDEYIVEFRSDAFGEVRQTLIDWFGFDATFISAAGDCVRFKALLRAYQCARILDEYGVDYTIL